MRRRRLSRLTRSTTSEFQTRRSCFSLRVGCTPVCEVALPPCEACYLPADLRRCKTEGHGFLIDTSVVMAVIQVISCDHTLLGIFSWTVLMCHRLQDRDHSSWLKVLAECILSLQSWSCYQQNR